MDDSRPLPISKLRGQVTRGEYGKGTKSEREAVFITTTSDGRYILRRKSGPAYDDSELERYVGHEVECDGFALGTTLLCDRIELVK